MKQFKGRVAAVTGAASGIGRALAKDLARRGAHLALADIDDVGLAETVAQCEGLGVKITSQHLDVADRQAVYAWADRVVADHGAVNLVVTNAGVAMLGAMVESMSYQDFEWLMNINFWGVVYGTKAFLPHLKASGEGHIVNVSSAFGLISFPSQSAYNAAKFAVRGFTDFSPGPDELAATSSVRVLVVGRVRRCIQAGAFRGDETDLAHVFVALVQGMAFSESAGRLGTSGASIDRRWALALDALFAGFAS